MRIAICTPMWGRAAVAQIFWAGVARLRATWGKHEVLAYTAGDQPELRQLAEANDAVWLEHENQPLGRKWSAIAQQAWQDGAEATVILGSDDLLDPELAEEYGKLFDSGQPERYAGVQGCAMIHPASRRALFIRGHAARGRIGEVIGAGRIYGREALDKVRGRPWPDFAKTGLDFRQTMRFRKVGIHYPDAVVTDGMVLDIKTGENIWSYDHIARHTNVVQSRDYDELVGRFPERDLIRELLEAPCRAIA